MQEVELKEVELKDLEAGDEILISCQSYFKYLRILRTPALGTKKHWSTGRPLYKAVKCSTRRDEVVHTYVHNGKSYTRTSKKWVFSPEDHNYHHYVDLECRQIVLIKKNEQ
jgi:hypothetical protein